MKTPKPLRNPNIMTFECDVEFDLFENGLHYFEGKTADGIPFLDVRARLFTTGRKRDIDYNEDSLKSMAEGFVSPTDDLKWTVPVTKGHWFTGDPDAVTGHVREFHTAHSQLRGTMRFVDPDAMMKVKRRQYQNLSIGVEETGKPGSNKWRVDHVALVPFGYVPEAQLYESGGPDMAEKIAEDKPTPEVPLPAPAPTAPAPTVTFSKEDVERMIAERTADYAKANEKLAASVEGLLKVQRFEANKAKVEEFKRTGKTLPVFAAEELALLNGLDEAGVTLYEAMKAKQPALVNFDRIGTVEARGPESQASDEAAVKKEAEELLAMRGFSKTEAGNWTR